jgi:ergothioneine biosynthesis protein EgtB
MKHLFSQNALCPAYREGAKARPVRAHAPAPQMALRWCRIEGGLVSIGHDGDGFAFDNERPRHKVFVEPFAMASRLATCAEYLEFIEDGGYRRPELWLSDGWSWVTANAVRSPLYWDLEKRELFTLRGIGELVLHEPVCHVTYFEADAFARWSNARLPREHEWEVAAASRPTMPDDGFFGSFADDERFHPSPVRHGEGGGIAQLLGDAWEWTSSAYTPYPGFEPFAGPFGEYNGKFMVSQMVLRGGSCVTPRDHIRTTYRNFFPPSAAWQFTGIRLARDAE